MGDRRNIVVVFDDKNSVALYTHWSGSDMQEVLARALDRGRGRWSDDTYITRIIFSQMIAEYDDTDVVSTLMSETGFGIEPFKTGTDKYCEASPGYDLVVDLRTNQVSDGDETVPTTFSFDAYVEAYKPAPA